jgi:hypothetical protein
MTGGKNALGSLFGQGPGHHGDEYEQGAIAVAEESRRERRGRRGW